MPRDPYETIEALRRLAADPAATPAEARLAVQRAAELTARAKSSGNPIVVEPPLLLLPEPPEHWIWWFLRGYVMGLVLWPTLALWVFLLFVVGLPLQLAGIDLSSKGAVAIVPLAMALLSANYVREGRWPAAIGSPLGFTTVWLLIYGPRWMGGLGWWG